MKTLRAAIVIAPLVFAACEHTPPAEESRNTTTHGDDRGEPASTGKADGTWGSCAGFCDGQSADGCWCDELCRDYGDCCHDEAVVCGSGEPSDLPGPTCQGTLTDSALASLYQNAPIVTLPWPVDFSGAAAPREIGTYTSALYRRSCDSQAGCGAWELADQPAHEELISQHPVRRAGKVYLFHWDGTDRLGIASERTQSVCGVTWTEGWGYIERNGDEASVEIGVDVESVCGNPPEDDLYDPAGMVTDRCFKLAYRKELNVITIGEDHELYDEYAVVYDGIFGVE